LASAVIRLCQLTKEWFIYFVGCRLKPAVAGQDYRSLIWVEGRKTLCVRNCFGVIGIASASIASIKLEVGVILGEHVAA
jgi:hypothetical protein